MVTGGMRKDRYIEGRKTTADNGQMGTSLVGSEWNPNWPGSNDRKLHTGWEWSVGDPGFQFEVLLGERDG